MDRLEGELSSQQFNTWIRPLQSIETPDSIRLLAPNQFVLNWVKNHYLGQIKNIVKDLSGTKSPNIVLEIGTRSKNKKATSPLLPENFNSQLQHRPISYLERSEQPIPCNLNPDFTFETFVEGK